LVGLRVAAFSAELAYLAQNFFPARPLEFMLQPRNRHGHDFVDDEMFRAFFVRQVQPKLVDERTSRFGFGARRLPSPL
jgi:hypothetical protein